MKYHTDSDTNVNYNDRRVSPSCGPYSQYEGPRGVACFAYSARSPGKENQVGYPYHDVCRGYDVREHDRSKFLVYAIKNNGNLVRIGMTRSPARRICALKNTYTFDSFHVLLLCDDKACAEMAEAMMIEIMRPPENKAKTDLYRSLSVAANAVCEHVNSANTENTDAG